MIHIQVCLPQDIKKDRELLHINGTFSILHQFQVFPFTRCNIPCVLTTLNKQCYVADMRVERMQQNFLKWLKIPEIFRNCLKTASRPHSLLLQNARLVSAETMLWQHHCLMVEIHKLLMDLGQQAEHRS